MENKIPLSCFYIVAPIKNLFQPPSLILRWLSVGLKCSGPETAQSGVLLCSIWEFTVLTFRPESVQNLCQACPAAQCSSAGPSWNLQAGGKQGRECSGCSVAWRSPAVGKGNGMTNTCYWQSRAALLPTFCQRRLKAFKTHHSEQLRLCNIVVMNKAI